MLHIKYIINIIKPAGGGFVGRKNNAFQAVLTEYCWFTTTDIVGEVDQVGCVGQTGLVSQPTHHQFAINDQKGLVGHLRILFNICKVLSVKNAQKIHHEPASTKRTSRVAREHALSSFVTSMGPRLTFMMDNALKQSY